MNDTPETSQTICACLDVHGFTCQFPKAPADQRFEGRDWCLFHLPAGDGNSLSPKEKNTGKFSYQHGWEAGGRMRNEFDNEINRLISEASSRSADLRGVIFPMGFVFPTIPQSSSITCEFAIFGGAVNFSPEDVVKIVNFNGVTFNGQVNFSGNLYRGRVSFSGARFNSEAVFKSDSFENEADFSHAEFADTADFSHVGFAKNVRFDHARFEAAAHFKGTSFMKDADFSGVTFRDDVDFLEAEFRNAANFYKTNFIGGAHFRTARFGENANFSDAIFDREARFEGAKFTSHANFRGARFELMASFWDAKLENTAEFDGATFNSMAHFNHTFIGRESRFEDTTFNKSVSFRNASFADSVIFRRTKFHADADFSAAKGGDPKFDFQQIRFTKVIFKGETSFENRTFVANASFNDAEFHDLVEFHGGTFHQGMSFHQTKFLKTKEDKLDTKKKNDEATEALERSYRTLKLGMETLRARNEEAMFFALEMEARRNRSDVPFTERFAAISYKYLSDYGRSILRPLGWLGFLIGYGFSYFYHLAQSNGHKTPGHVLRFVIEQIALPFSVWSNRYEADRWMDAYLKTEPWLLRVPATVITLFAFSLIALFLLALRRRFKMD